MLSPAFAMEQLQPISRRRRQISQLVGAIELPQLGARNGFDCAKTPARLSSVKAFGFRAAERPNHFSHFML